MQINKKTITNCSAIITHSDLVRILQKEFKTDSDMSIQFQVPGGGDYSNMALDIEDSIFDHKHGLKITWKEEY